MESLCETSSFSEELMELTCFVEGTYHILTKIEKIKIKNRRCDEMRWNGMGLNEKILTAKTLV